MDKVMMISGGEYFYWKPVILAIAAMAAAVAVYLFAAVKTRAVTGDDLRLVPHGDKLAAWLHIM